jgi:hypothetical protein
MACFGPFFLCRPKTILSKNGFQKENAYNAEREDAAAQETTNHVGEAYGKKAGGEGWERQQGRKAKMRCPAR